MSQRQAQCPVCGGDATCAPLPDTLGAGSLLDAQCSTSACRWFFTSPEQRRRIDAAEACEPCMNCGEHCDSQLEFAADHNDGRPWDTCSGCMATNAEMNAAIVRHATLLPSVLRQPPSTQ